MEHILPIGLVVVGLWILYMATFRTKDFIELVDKDQDRRDRQAARFGKAVKGAAALGRWLKKK